MSNILIINAAKQFGSSAGKLNTYLSEVARDVLAGAGHNVKITQVDNEYDIHEEVAKYLWADVVIYQMPVWWMAEPWILKKYIDEVFTAGYGKLFMEEGHSHSGNGKKYGSAGLLHKKKYMLSLTWNAPLEAFIGPDQFFEGKGVDALYYHFHKANQFMGLSPLPTFMCNEVEKKTDIGSDVSRYRMHLMSVLA